MKNFFFLFLLSLFVCSTLAANFIQVDPENHFFLDAQGRVRLFHGFNVVYKIPPYVPPELDSFDPALSFCEEDMDNLQKWGFNFIRLGVMWPGVAPERGYYNSTYLDQIEWIVEELGKRDIYVLIDCHQDVLARGFCGEGAADWAVIVDPDIPHFPAPLPYEFDFDPETDYPNLDQCLSHWFGAYYFSRAASNAFQNLYDNKQGILDEFGKYWAFVAKRFANTTNVLGYEFINEPWAGDFYANPKRLVPGYTDLHSLQPMYEKLNAYIRAQDSDHIVFYEPVTFDIGPVGFNATPGGVLYKDRQALSFHVYCAAYKDNMTATAQKFCEKYDAQRFPLRTKDLDRLGGAGLLTEFGSVGNSTNGITEIQNVLTAADENFFGWAYWQFKSYNDLTATERTVYPLYDEQGQLEVNKLKALSRTYATAIAGTPLSTSFDVTDGFYNLSWLVNANITEPTEIYLNEELWYANGYSIDISPSGYTKVSSEENRIKIYLNGSKIPQALVLTVTINSE